MRGIWQEVYPSASLNKPLLAFALDITAFFQNAIALLVEDAISVQGSVFAGQIDFRFGGSIGILRSSGNGVLSEGFDRSSNIHAVERSRLGCNQTPWLTSTGLTKR